MATAGRFSIALDFCVNEGTIFTYNQGVILSGLIEIAWSSGDNSYSEEANNIALKAIQHFSNLEGIFTEPCEPNSCDSGEAQFRGVFARNLQFVVGRANWLPDDFRDLYVKFLQRNADAIWANSNNGLVALRWNVPATQQQLGNQPDIMTQSSALDMLLAAAVTY